MRHKEGKRCTMRQRREEVYYETKKGRGVLEHCENRLAMLTAEWLWLRGLLWYY